MVQTGKKESRGSEYRAVTPPIVNESSLPLFLMSPAPGMSVVQWVQHHRDLVDKLLRTHGAVLFRGFDMCSTRELERLALEFMADLFEENGEHENVSGRVQTPVFYPSEQRLLWHNENSFNHHWPLKILFACSYPPERGGETTLVDSRKLCDVIPESVQGRFRSKQIMYVRNYGTGFGLDWREVFRSANKGDVERMCKENRMELEWLPGDGLRTMCVRPATVTHPLNGTLCWFNQVQHWHPACLDPELRTAIKKMFGDGMNAPRNCFFGDGSLISDEDIKSIVESYERLEVLVHWNIHDVLIVDNAAVAHGRRPFSGQRKLLVVMGDRHAYPDVDMMPEDANSAKGSS